MKRYLRHGALALFALLVPGLDGGRLQHDRHDVRLPDGKSQREEILKADHAKDLADARALVELAGDLQRELEKNDRHVLSVASIRKTEEIEKLAKRIRSRLRRD